ncbi:hypothetical protein ETAA8_20270 [Anatilimnocola aggregata]|uniref:DUF3352 domain-containing protein n=1 Tax=Anatilimnocola aggregata TaxID=2528021 RepID=A0A517Y9M8_9BACT|nr:DUF3352 domain-containing protein [Anatilimnocola aggregata]QDU26943.1 hypothetical protein ETAA8_20270 [Anatilimnocola aggregata]
MLTFVRPFLAGCLLALVSLTTLPAQAQRPVAPKLLPEQTLGYFRILDTPQLIERFRETSLGRMGADEQIKPLVSEFYAALQELWGNIEDRVGLPLDQVLSVPQGEICIAFISVPEGPTGLVIIIDVKDRLLNARKLLEKGEIFAAENQITKTTEKLDGYDIHLFANQNGRTQAVQLERDGTIVITSGKNVMKLLLDAWDGKLEKTLADNDRFNTIMNRCQGTPDDPPQLTYFVDPVQIAKIAARGNFAAQTGLALLPVLGVDGIKGVGGSLIFSSGEFDSVSHIHLLLESPRSGVVEMLALGSGDTAPEPWVPADSMNYNTLHWKFGDTYRLGAKLYNSLMAEGAAEAEVKTRVQEWVGLDFETEILPAMEGRVSHVAWIEKPIKLNSQANILGIKLRDVKAFQPTFDKLREKFKENLEEKAYAGVTYYAIKTPPPANEPPANLRRPDPCIATLGDYLILTDSSQAIQQAIITHSQPGTSLAAELDYKLIASKIRRQNGGETPGLVRFTRPEVGMKLLYDLAQSEDTQGMLSRQAESNQFFGRLEKAMKDNPLPPFSVIARYFAPGGAMIVNDETGFHYTDFTLKRK